LIGLRVLLTRGNRRQLIPLAFGYPATNDFFTSWADRHDFCLDRTPQRRAENAFWEILNRLPDDLRRICLIHPRQRSSTLTTCIVVASNRTREDLQMALDKNLIKMFRKSGRDGILSPMINDMRE
jgi:hypothetical protein